MFGTSLTNDQKARLEALLLELEGTDSMLDGWEFVKRGPNLWDVVTHNEAINEAFMLWVDGWNAGLQNSKEKKAKKAKADRARWRKQRDELRKAGKLRKPLYMKARKKAKKAPVCTCRAPKQHRDCSYCGVCYAGDVVCGVCKEQGIDGKLIRGTGRRVCKLHKKQ